MTRVLFMALALTGCVGSTPAEPACRTFPVVVVTFDTATVPDSALAVDSIYYDTECGG